MQFRPIVKVECVGLWGCLVRVWTAWVTSEYQRLALQVAVRLAGNGQALRASRRNEATGSMARTRCEEPLEPSLNIRSENAADTRCESVRVFARPKSLKAALSSFTLCAVSTLPLPSPCIDHRRFRSTLNAVKRLHAPCALAGLSLLPRLASAAHVRLSRLCLQCLLCLALRLWRGKNAHKFPRRPWQTRRSRGNFLAGVRLSPRQTRRPQLAVPSKTFLLSPLPPVHCRCGASNRSIGTDAGRAHRSSIPSATRPRSDSRC